MTNTPIPTDLTAKEKDVLDTIERLSGRDFVEENWHLILEQAKALGEVDEPRMAETVLRSVPG
jgi:hypothetical protein